MTDFIEECMRKLHHTLMEKRRSGKGYPPTEKKCYNCQYCFTFGEEYLPGEICQGECHALPPTPMADTKSQQRSLVRHPGVFPAVILTDYCGAWAAYDTETEKDE